jgi:hypothetical protein
VEERALFREAKQIAEQMLCALTATLACAAGCGQVREERFAVTVNHQPSGFLAGASASHRAAPRGE